jgi:2-polyprenyl-6-methoxyphenol hydroxylase-like FAD-dependent oxidoreductase
LKKGLVPKGRNTYFKNHLLFSGKFPIPTEGQLPLFLNLSQVQTEAELLTKVKANPLIEILWQHKVVRLEQDEAKVTLFIDNKGTDITLTADYVVGADGCKSKVRECCGLKFEGLVCPSKFRIVDIRAKLKRPAEHHFHFNGRQNPQGAFLIVPQPDDVHRIDWQMPANYDHEKDRPNLSWHVERAIGGGTEFQIIWDSCYQFQQRLVNSMSSGRVFLAGDAAHLVAPFGARGMNSGIQDARMVAGLIARVLKGQEPEEILGDYATERGEANAEHQRITTRTMQFIAPATLSQTVFRNFILLSCRRFPKLRQFVNSGSMSNAPLAPFPAHLMVA